MLLMWMRLCQCQSARFQVSMQCLTAAVGCLCMARSLSQSVSVCLSLSVSHWVWVWLWLCFWLWFWFRFRRLNWSLKFENLTSKIELITQSQKNTQPSPAQPKHISGKLSTLIVCWHPSKERIWNCPACQEVVHGEAHCNHVLLSSKLQK